MNLKTNSMKTLLFFFTSCLFTYSLFSQTNCNAIPEVNFPGGRVILSFDGNVHDDDDIVALPMSVGLWWAAGLKDRVVQVEYNNHVCNTNTNENDGSGAGAGDDSQNMQSSASGSISRFGYNSGIFYNYENQGSASTNKMAAEIEKSTASNPLWILAGGPMETIWRGLEQASRGHGNVTIISHSNWNEQHNDCTGDHTWNDLKNKYNSRGVYFVGFCAASSNCSGPDKLGDQNSRLSASLSSWNWMKTSGHEYNRYIYTRNPFGSEKFDPSDAGMSYFLISGGPFNNGEKRSTISDFQKLLENPCGSASKPPTNTVPTISFVSPAAGSSVATGSNVSVKISASDTDGNIVKHRIFLNGNLVSSQGSNYNPYTISNIKTGSYTLKAIVTDDDGATAAKSISFNASSSGTTTLPTGDAPIVSVTSPSNGQNFAVGNSFYITLKASDPNGSIVKHQIFINNKLVDTDGGTYSPYQFSKITQGTHSIRAVVVANDGQTASQTISITAGDSSSSSSSSSTPTTTTGNKSPVVTILSPKNGQNYSPGALVTVNLSASDPDGSIAKHLIFVNNKLVDTDGGTYTPYKISNAIKGSYTLKAEVTDNKGAKTIATTTFTVGGSTSKSISSASVASTKGEATTEEGLTTEAGLAALTTEVEEAAFLTIAPNPVRDKTLHIFQNGNKFMRIVDLSGNILRKMVIDQREITVDLGDVPPGIYILIADSKSTKFVVK